MSVVYSEIDAYCCDWLVDLQAAYMISKGDVARGDFRLVDKAVFAAATRAHFFAGIGVWDLALRMAKWPLSWPVWTGSCPCQPFSSAGRRKGISDDRHLWPDWFKLIDAHRPPVIFGEQVASKDGLAWFDSVQDDLEGAGYTVFAADLCAAGVGAPHLRQRLYFVASADHERLKGFGLHLQPGEQREAGAQAARRGAPSVVGDSRSPRSGRDTRGLPCEQGSGTFQGFEPRYLAHELVPPGSTRGAWEAADWLYCQDGKHRPVEPGSFPLAHGAPARVGRLRAYGNAIVPQVAATFISVVMEAIRQ